MSEWLEALRRSTWPLSWLWAGAALVRNAMFSTGLRRVHRLGVPVVSVGNLASGGTGKTPLVAFLVERALELGLRPGVLARGYGRAPGEELNDEGRMLAARFPGLLQVQDPDRVRGGRRLQEAGAQIVVMDDGFQHRRLHRDRDLVCLDAARPLAGGQCLPAGDLREPACGLRRAHVAVLTRAGGVREEARGELTRRLHRLAGERLVVLFAEHAPRDLLAMPAGHVHPIGELRNRRWLLLSGIARPRSFEETVRASGGTIVGHVSRRDHHRHTPEELAAVLARARGLGASLLVTEKDEAKLAGREEERWVLRVDLRFLGGEPAPEVLGLVRAGVP